MWKSAEMFHHLLKQMIPKKLPRRTRGHAGAQRCVVLNLNYIFRRFIRFIRCLDSDFVFVFSGDFLGDDYMDNGSLQLNMLSLKMSHVKVVHNFNLFTSVKSPFDYPAKQLGYLSLPRNRQFGVHFVAICPSFSVFHGR